MLYFPVFKQYCLTCPLRFLFGESWVKTWVTFRESFGSLGAPWGNSLGESLSGILGETFEGFLEELIGESLRGSFSGNLGGILVGIMVELGESWGNFLEESKGNLDNYLVESWGNPFGGNLSGESWGSPLRDS